MSDEPIKSPKKKAAVKAVAPPAPVEPVCETNATSTAAIAVATTEPVVEPVTLEPAAAPVEAVAEPITPAPVQKGTDMTDTAATDATSKAQAMWSDMNARTKSAVEKSTKLFEEMNDFNKGNIEALVESSRVAAKAAETLSQHAAETARKNFEQATAAMKSMASVKTPTELFQLQSDLARKSFDDMIAEMSKTSETMLKLAGDVFQPLSNRFAVAADKFKAAA
jgi:phasin family protein